MLLTNEVEEEDTQVGPPPPADTDRRITAIAFSDTGEWDDTDRDVPAQAKIETTPEMFEDTGVMIIEKPVPQEVSIAESDRFSITFKEPTNPLAQPARASTAGGWPPPPRKPATPAPQIRERAFKRAGVYKSVGRPDTN